MDDVYAEVAKYLLFIRIAKGVIINYRGSNWITQKNLEMCNGQQLNQEVVE